MPNLLYCVFLAWQVQGLNHWQTYLEKLGVKVFEYGLPDLKTLLSGLTLLKQNGFEEGIH